MKQMHRTSTLLKVQQHTFYLTYLVNVLDIFLREFNIAYSTALVISQGFYPGLELLACSSTPLTLEVLINLKKLIMFSKQ